jgi:hypothetical protein
MAKQSPLQAILNKPLSRREFLQHVGVMLLAVIGISQVFQHLTKHTPQQPAMSENKLWGNGKFGV